MDASKLYATLLKEVKASPVKSGALGLLCVVAIWFWGPLVMKWIRPEEELPPEKSPAGAPAAAPVAAAPAAPLGVASAPVLDWRSVQKVRATDPRVRALRLTETSRDPFRREMPAVAATPAETETPLATEAVEKGPVSPQEAGLVLQGTLVSLRRSMATINGKNFERGTTVIAARDGAAKGTDELEYKIVEIAPASVILDQKGTRFTLALKKAAVAESERMQIGRKK